MNSKHILPAEEDHRKYELDEAQVVDSSREPSSHVGGNQVHGIQAKSQLSSVKSPVSQMSAISKQELYLNSPNAPNFNAPGVSGGVDIDQEYEQKAFQRVPNEDYVSDPDPDSQSIMDLPPDDMNEMQKQMVIFYWKQNEMNMQQEFNKSMLMKEASKRQQLLQQFDQTYEQEKEGRDQDVRRLNYSESVKNATQSFNPDSSNDQSSVLNNLYNTKDEISQLGKSSNNIKHKGDKSAVDLDNSKDGPEKQQKLHRKRRNCWQRFDDYMWLGNHNYFYICAIHEYCIHFQKAEKLPLFLIFIRSALFLTIFALIILDYVLNNQLRWYQLSDWVLFMTLISTLFNLLCSIKYLLCMKNFKITLQVSKNARKSLYLLKGNSGKSISQEPNIGQNNSNSMEDSLLLQQKNFNMNPQLKMSIQAIDILIDQIEMVQSSRQGQANKNFSVIGFSTFKKVTMQPRKNNKESKYNPFQIYKWSVILFNISVVYSVVNFISYFCIALPDILIPDLTGTLIPCDPTLRTRSIVLNALDHSIPLIILLIEFSVNCSPIIWRHFSLSFIIGAPYILSNIFQAIGVRQLRQGLTWTQAVFRIALPVAFVILTVFFELILHKCYKYKLKINKKQNALLQMQRINAQIKLKKGRKSGSKAGMNAQNALIDLQTDNMPASQNEAGSNENLFGSSYKRNNQHFMSITQN